ncbi:hypothetical protein A946_00045 [Methylacidiphilum kamchatkense Kam1]|uniref:Permease n=1 Tax=Methylacidiphilum kamchatkense Kam1 TaxID=1202785 RepID=A0ABR4ZY60_9BACT|nr:lipid II flippase MurJ [Methylacidiphilum kamchatkense]KIE59172.1 hypothetical protein A946_00045 [Methylacidiphilum kamchatkense Kam1]
MDYLHYFHFFLSFIALIILYQCTSKIGSGAIAVSGLSYKLLILVSLIPSAISTVLFQRISLSHVKNDTISKNFLIEKGLRSNLYFAIPLMALVFMLRKDIISLFLGHGMFNQAAVDWTSTIFGFFLMCIPAPTINDFTTKIFFNNGDSYTPSVITSFLAIGQYIGFPLITKYGRLELLVLFIVFVSYIQAFLLFYFLSIKLHLKYFLKIYSYS